MESFLQSLCEFRIWQILTSLISSRSQNLINHTPNKTTNNNCPSEPLKFIKQHSKFSPMKTSKTRTWTYQWQHLVLPRVHGAKLGMPCLMWSAPSCFAKPFPHLFRQEDLIGVPGLFLWHNLTLHLELQWEAYRRSRPNNEYHTFILFLAVLLCWFAANSNKTSDTIKFKQDS